MIILQLQLVRYSTSIFTPTEPDRTTTIAGPIERDALVASNLHEADYTTTPLSTTSISFQTYTKSVHKVAVSGSVPKKFKLPSGTKPALSILRGSLAMESGYVLLRKVWGYVTSDSYTEDQFNDSATSRANWTKVFKTIGKVIKVVAKVAEVVIPFLLTVVKKDKMRLMLEQGVSSLDDMGPEDARVMKFLRDRIDSRMLGTPSIKIIRKNSKRKPKRLMGATGSGSSQKSHGRKKTGKGQ
jgi:hypothetical protein